MDTDNDDILWYRLHAIVKALPNWMMINREVLMTQVIASVLNNFRAQPSPEPTEGIETGLDFLGLQLTEGGDNGLYETTMNLLDGEIYSAVCGLDNDEQIVLLLPMLDDAEDMARDRDIGEWAKCLRTGGEWQQSMRQIALNGVEPRERCGT